MRWRVTVVILSVDLLICHSVELSISDLSDRYNLIEAKRSLMQLNQVNWEGARRLPSRPQAGSVWGEGW